MLTFTVEKLDNEDINEIHNDFLTFLQARHGRLGKDSPVHEMDDLIIHHVFEIWKGLMVMDIHQRKMTLQEAEHWLQRKFLNQVESIYAHPSLSKDSSEYPLE